MPNQILSEDEILKMIRGDESRRREHDERAKTHERMSRVGYTEYDPRLGIPTPDAIAAPTFQALALQLCWSTPTIEVIQEFIRQAELLRLDFAEATTRPRDEPVSMAEDAIRRRALEECRHQPASEVMRGLQHMAHVLGELVGLQNDSASSGQQP